MSSDSPPERPAYEKDKLAELTRQELERKQFLEGHEEGKAAFLDRASKQNIDPIEIEEKLKAMEENRKERYQALTDEQQRRMDLLELRHLGPPSERER